MPEEVLDVMPEPQVIKLCQHSLEPDLSLRVIAV